METIGGFVGKRLRELRKQRGLTQEALSQTSGVPQGNISRLERGAIDDLQVSTLLGLARGLRVPPQRLLPEHPRRPRPTPAAAAAS